MEEVSLDLQKIQIPFILQYTEAEQKINFATILERKKICITITDFLPLFLLLSLEMRIIRKTSLFILIINGLLVKFEPEPTRRAYNLATPHPRHSYIYLANKKNSTKNEEKNKKS